MINQPYDPKKKVFVNPYIKDTKRTIKDALLWKVGYFDEIREKTQMPPHFIAPIKKEPIDPSKPKATWINHSTYLIHIEGTNILTDPIWGRRCSPLSFLGPIRRHAAPLELEDLQKVDHVLISHNHYDHLDKKTVLTLHKLYPTIQWWVPLGVKKWFRQLGILQVEEFGWWEKSPTIPLKNSSTSMQLTAVPTQHFSGRSLKDKDKTLWVGWVAEFSKEKETKRLYFVGDTGYNEFDFKAIGEKWSHMDLSLIPIGSYVPRKFMGTVHIDPKQAVQIHKEVSSKLSLGMHWRTFRLSDEESFRPPYDLFLALQEEGINPMQFIAPPPGHPVNW